MRHTTVVTLGLVAALLAGAAPLYAEPSGGQMRDDDVVARVNGTVIYRKSVRDVVQGILAVQDSPPDPAGIGKLADDALDSLIALELLYQESQARNITVNDKAVDEEIARSKSQFPSPQAFETAMKSKGMTEADLRRDTRKTMAVNRLLESTVWKDLRVTSAQIKDFYERNKEEFKHPPEIRASHILIHVPEGASAGDRAAAKQRASQLLDKLKAGSDFAQLARESSQDPGSAALGGDLGYVSKGEMDETFEKQAFALAPGQLSGIVSTPYGFDIIKVTDSRGAGYAPLAEVEDRIREVLLKRTRQQRQADFVAELRKKGKIEVKP
jgi:peptidyl-prolyl cis-trans isomerase C